MKTPPLLLLGLVLCGLSHPVILRAEDPAIVPVHVFADSADGETNADGEYPDSDLIALDNGDEYGTAPEGGLHGKGTLFKISAAGDFSVVRSFDGANDGSRPKSLLASDANGNLFGTTEILGPNNSGTIYCLTAAGNFSVIYSDPTVTGPLGGLVRGADDAFYGLTANGGDNNQGVIYRMVSDGTAAGTTVTVLYSFAYQDGDPVGRTPVTSLTLGADGNYYGLTIAGGANGLGSLFKVVTDGTPDNTTVTPLHPWATADNFHPSSRSRLTNGPAGFLYGTSVQGGTNSRGFIYQVSTVGGDFTSLYSFPDVTTVNNASVNSTGAFPSGGLVPGDNGHYVGLAGVGGPNGFGTIYDFSTDGTPAGSAVTALAAFSAPDNSDANVEGYAPGGELLKTPDGYYGSAAFGGKNQYGTIFGYASASVPPLPNDNTVSFGAPSTSADEGDVVHVPVVRGTKSTGQVIVYFQVSGTATEQLPGSRTYDYTFTYPADYSNSVTLLPSENTKDIVFKVAKSPASEPSETVVLNLVQVAGDATLGTALTSTVTLVDGKPAILKAPVGLGIVAQNTLTKTRADAAVVVIGLTGGDWTFTTTDALPAGNTGGGVRVEASTTKTGPWAKVLDLKSGAAGKWLGITQTPPQGSSIYFRAVAHAQGYPDSAGAPTVKPYSVQPGPNLNLKVENIGSASDVSGFTAHPAEFLDYQITVTNTGQAAGANVVVMIPIPALTTLENQTNLDGSPDTVTIAKKLYARWRFPGNLAVGGTYSERLTLQVNPAAAYGYTIPLTGFTVAADHIKVGRIVGHSSLETEVVGPITLQVTSDVSSARPGDVITYTLKATNSDTRTVGGGIVTDRLPTGTRLEALYSEDSGNHSFTASPLMNPNGFSNPAILYTRNPEGGTFDPASFSDPLVKVAALALLATKPGTLIDLQALRVKYNLQTNQKLLDAVNAAVGAQAIVPAGVKWVINSFPAKSSIIIKYSVRVLYDVQPGSPLVGATGIENSQYDFTIPASGNKTLSALYGKKPALVSSTLLPPDPNAADNKPVLNFSKFPGNRYDLAYDKLHGNGYQTVPGEGTVTTAVQHHGFDFNLLFENTGNSDAHQVVLHDVIPGQPTDVQLVGYFKQSSNGGAFQEMTLNQFTFYDKSGNILLPSGVEDTVNLAKVRSMDIRLNGVDALTPLPAHSYGVIKYTLTPLVAPAAAGRPPTYINALGGYDATLARSNPAQGAYMTCTDLEGSQPQIPDLLRVKVVSDVTFRIDAVKTFGGQAHAGDSIPFLFDIYPNGDTPATNAVFSFTIPKGTTLRNDTQGSVNNAPLVYGASSSTYVQPSSTGAGTVAQIPLGNFTTQTDPNRKKSLLFYLKVNSPLDAALVSKGRVFLDPAPQLKATPVISATASRHAVAAPVPSVTTVATAQPVPVSINGNAGLGIGRSAPFVVQKGGQFVYTIYFANYGDTAATNVEVGMQVPYGCYFVDATSGLLSAYDSATQVSSPMANNHPWVAKSYRTAAQRSASGPLNSANSPDLLQWHFDSLPGHSSGAILLKVQAFENFGNDAIRDNSCYITAANAPSCVIAPNPIGTFVQVKSFQTSIWETLGSFCEHIGIQIDSTTHEALAAYTAELHEGSQVHAMGNLGGIELNGGATVYQLGLDQVLVVASVNSGTSLIAQGGGNLVAQGGGNLVAQGGGNLVAQGGGNLVAQGGGNIVAGGNGASITIQSNGSSLLASTALDQALQLVAQGGGNLIAGPNIIAGVVSNDGGSFVQLSNHAGVASTDVEPTNANLVAQSGGNLVAQGGGNLIAPGAPLVAQGGGNLTVPSTLISQDGGGLMTKSGGDISAHSGGGLISQDGGGLISQDGGGFSKATNSFTQAGP